MQPDGQPVCAAAVASHMTSANKTRTTAGGDAADADLVWAALPRETGVEGQGGERGGTTAGREDIQLQRIAARQTTKLKIHPILAQMSSCTASLVMCGASQVSICIGTRARGSGASRAVAPSNFPTTIGCE